MMQIDKYWLRVFLWMALIFVISSDLGSATHTGRIVEPCLRWLNPRITPPTIAMVHFFIRKFGHMSGYAVLALLTLKATRNTLGVLDAGWSWRAGGWALAVTAGYAATDEFHQLFVKSRGASVGDVMIDTTGGAIALCLAFGWITLHRRWTESTSGAVVSS